MLKRNALVLQNLHKHFGIKICFVMLLNFDVTCVQTKNTSGGFVPPAGSPMQERSNRSPDESQSPGPPGVGAWLGTNNLIP